MSKRVLSQHFLDALRQIHFRRDGTLRECYRDRYNPDGSLKTELYLQHGRGAKGMVTASPRTDTAPPRSVRGELCLPQLVTGRAGLDWGS